MSRLAVSAALLLVVSSAAGAQQLAARSLPPRATAAAAGTASTKAREIAAAEAARATRAPVLDGRADDEAWAAASTIDGFRMWDPTEDGDPHFRTEARVAYDDHNLYVLIRAFDPHPDSIVARLARRDSRSGSDEVRVMVDGYRDLRTGFEFIVNPAGVKRDVAIINDNEEDGSWDAVWDAAARIDSLGWVAEFRIPLSQIRYPAAASNTFGLMVQREVPRLNERYAWPSFRRSKSGLVSQFGELSGIRGLASPRRLEVAPYTVVRTENTPRGAGFTQMQTGTMGADVKYGITSNLTLDATVNPDFGQVEADPSVLNLGTSETFFNERRPFFLEGQGLFRFDINCNDGRCSGLFYSRRIGRAPQLGGEYGDETNPTSTNILGAAKLSGRLANGVSVGVMDAVTSREVAPGDATIEPETNYFVGRVQKELRGGQTSIGVMGTNVRRSLDDWSVDLLRREAIAGGLDVRHQFSNKTYEVSGYVAQSRVAGSEDAIARTQRNLVHNYARPDDDVAYDSTLTSLGGASAQVVIAKIAGKHTRFSTGYQYVSPGFEINDVGFLGRANSQNQFFWYQVRDNTPRHFWRQWTFNVNQWTQFTAGGLRSEVGGNVNAHMQLKNNWWLHAGQGGNSLVASDCDVCARGGPAVRQDPSGWGWAGVEGDGRKRVVPYFFAQWGWGDEGRSHNLSLDPQVDFRLSSRFNASLGAGYALGTNATQWVDNFGAAGAPDTHYTFAALDQKTLSMTTRLNFTATPTLSLQVYAQPFVTSGRYDGWNELADARAARFADRFKPYAPAEGSLRDYDFNFKQLRSTSVLRWEYRPGSTLFFVWTQEREDAAADAGSFRAGRDYRTLFSSHPRNVFLIKGSYWLSM